MLTETKGARRGSLPQSQEAQGKFNAPGAGTRSPGWAQGGTPEGLAKRARHGVKECDFFVAGIKPMAGVYVIKAGLQTKAQAKRMYNN
ncbi:MAG: hypothetical protein ACI3X7_01530 [Bacteroidaceae bacterium]